MSELYLVTGGAGYLGNTLIRRLVELGKDVRILVLPSEENIPEGNVEVSYGDILDPESLKGFFNNPEGKELIVIHTAGIVSIASKFEQRVYDVNVKGTENIVALCEANSIKKLIYTSSVHAIPEKPKGETIYEIAEFNPDNVVGLYAKTKAEATHLVLEASKRGLNASIVHPSGMSGPFDNGRGYLTTLVIDYCKGRLTAAINGGYDFVDVRDVTEGIISCCEKGRNGECYILSNKYFSVREILYMLHEITGKREIKIILPFWFIKIMAPLAELHYKIRKQPPLFTPYSIYTINSNSLFSHDKATLELGYQTRSMKGTLGDTVNWLKENKRL